VRLRQDRPPRHELVAALFKWLSTRQDPEFMLKAVKRLQLQDREALSEDEMLGSSTMYAHVYESPELHGCPEFMALVCLRVRVCVCVCACVDVCVCAGAGAGAFVCVWVYVYVD